jgi:hypothetical protein
MQVPSDDLEPPFSTEELVSVCESMLENSRFLSPKSWPIDLYRYPDCWVFLLKDEGEAISRKSLGLTFKTIDDIKKTFVADKMSGAGNIPYFETIEL